MGGTLVEGLIKSKQVKAGDVCVADPNADHREKYRKMGAHVTADNREAAQWGDVVCVVVKPWVVESVLKGIADVFNSKRQMLVVVAAGVSSECIRAWMGANCPPLFLAIPNIAISELSSMTFVVPVGATEEQTQTIVNMFDRMGQTMVTDEGHLACGTTLASCGIAYALRYIRAASEGGVEIGFKAGEAKQIVMQTVLGAVRLLEATGMHPEALIDLVTTPDGVSIKGLNEMEHAGFSSSVVRGLKAGLK